MKNTPSRKFFTNITIFVLLMIFLVGGYGAYKVKQKGLKRSLEILTSLVQFSKDDNSGERNYLQKNFAIGFESNRETLLFEKREGVTSERSAEHATEGRQALKVDFPAGTQFPGLQLEVFGRNCFNWKNQRIFLADVFNAAGHKIDLQVKIKSGKNYPKKNFERTFPFD